MKSWYSINDIDVLEYCLINIFLTGPDLLQVFDIMEEGEIYIIDMTLMC